MSVIVRFAPSPTGLLHVGNIRAALFNWLSARTPHAMPYAAVRERLPADLGEAFWLAVRGNLTALADARMWAEVVHWPIVPRIEEPAFLSDAAEALPAERPGRTRPGRPGRARCRRRAAATAGRCSIRFGSRSPRRTTGRRWPGSWPLIGRAKAKARLGGEAA